MRSRDLRLIAGMSVTAAIAVAALAAVTSTSQAQMRGGNLSVAPRAPTVIMRTAPTAGGSSISSMKVPSISSSGMRTPSFSGSSFRAEPRFQRFNNDKVVVTDDGKGKGTDKGRGKGKGKGTDVVNVDPTGDDGRPGRRKPKRPNIGPIIGTGVAIGTGLAVGTLGPTGPAGAGTPPLGGTLPSGGGASTQRIYLPPAGENRFVENEMLLEFRTQAGIPQLLARQGLIQLESQAFTLTNSTIVRVRIANRRPVRVALLALRNETAVFSGQPNHIFRGMQSEEISKVTPAVATAAAIPTGGDPAQYALSKLRIGEAHQLATGDRVLVAVIDSGIDLSHPELAGAVAGSYDALGKAEKPHQHGTAIAGAIAAHARLMGAAPAAKILAIRAFGASGASAEATTMAILKSIEYASQQQALIINMSFAGPSDPNLARHLAAAKAKGAVLIAATGNFGPKSPPQYPAADPNVIAVSATDADDKMFRASNIGPHVAVAAPGVDILLPSPDNEYRLISGTSFSAAYVSGVVALVLQRAPGLSPDALRDVLLKTAKDLGPVGKDPEFGAGLVDAYQAIMAVQPPSAAASAQPASATVSVQDVSLQSAPAPQVEPTPAQDVSQASAPAPQVESAPKEAAAQ